MQEMKVLYIAHSAGLQGAGFALLNILKGITLNGIIPIVILPAKGDMYNEITKMGIKCYVMPYYMDIYPFLRNIRDYLLFIPKIIRYFRFYFLVKKKVKAIIKDENIDVIHTNTGVIHWGSELAEELGIPHVWHIREMQDLDFGYKPIKSMAYFRKLCSKTNNHCIAITKSVFNHHILDPIKDSIIYDGVYPKNILKKEISLKKDNYFLFVGTLTKAKGVFDAISAFDEIANDYPELELWIAGHINTTVSEYLTKNVKNRNRIKLLGFRRDVYRLMSKAKALLVPSYFEGFGFITAESMMNGCLVIGRDTAGTKEQFDNGYLSENCEIGFRFNTQEELVKHMKFVIHAPNDVFSEILLAARRASAKYTIENNVKQIVNLYLKIVE